MKPICKITKCFKEEKVMKIYMACTYARILGPLQMWIRPRTYFSYNVGQELGQHSWCSDYAMD